MEFKLNINYSELLPKYIVDEELANEIICSVDFVEKYIDNIDIPFSGNKDKQIAHKQLGTIVFSCVEALWKSIVLTVNKNCEKRDCKEECKYHQFDSLDTLSNTPPGKVLAHLVNMRLLYIHSFEKEAIQNLQNLRNHIHLTRTLIDGDKSVKFNKQFVEDMLRLYYVTINQAEMNHWYYDESQPCLCEPDCDGHETTQKQQKYANKEYFTNKIILVCFDIFYKNPITEKMNSFAADIKGKKL